MLALVVDDSRAMRMVLRRMLVELGFTVQEAPDGPEALEILASGVMPDLMLIDWHMPQMQGIELVTALRSADVDYSGRIVMVTTETEVAQITRALDSGADEYLMKPFTSDAVTEKLHILGLV
jgi:two-component system chemotaxis response regulator CheY